MLLLTLKNPKIQVAVFLEAAISRLELSDRSCDFPRCASRGRPPLGRYQGRGLATISLGVIPLLGSAPEGAFHCAGLGP